MSEYSGIVLFLRNKKGLMFVSTSVFVYSDIAEFMLCLVWNR